MGGGGSRPRVWTDKRGMEGAFVRVPCRLLWRVSSWGAGQGAGTSYASLGSPPSCRWTDMPSLSPPPLFPSPHCATGQGWGTGETGQEDWPFLRGLTMRRETFRAPLHWQRGEGCRWPSGPQPHSRGSQAVQGQTYGRGSLGSLRTSGSKMGSASHLSLWWLGSPEARLERVRGRASPIPAAPPLCSEAPRWMLGALWVCIWTPLPQILQRGKLRSGWVPDPKSRRDLMPLWPVPTPYM